MRREASVSIRRNADLDCSFGYTGGVGHGEMAIL